MPNHTLNGISEEHKKRGVTWSLAMCAPDTEPGGAFSATALGGTQVRGRGSRVADAELRDAEVQRQRVREQGSPLKTDSPHGYSLDLAIWMV